MEKFIKIALSISDLTTFEGYEITRLDIQFMGREKCFYGFLVLENRSTKDIVEFEIHQDGSFSEI